jgi:branched-chain amino acid aminotransferase
LEQITVELEQRMFEGSVCINGVLGAARDARISVFDRGFLFGDSAFEVMRTYQRVPFREREHLLRLRASCERLLISLPSDIEALSRDVHRTIEASSLLECYVRLMVTRGEGPMSLDLSEAKAPSVVVFALPLRTLPAEAYEQGVFVGLSHASRATDGTRAMGAKTSNYLGSVLALHEVKQRGCHEALIVGPHGEVIEGATSNVFLVRDGVLATPPIEAGILAGITRRTVLEMAGRLRLTVHETQVHPADLYRADEVFITSSVREIVPVVRVDDVDVGNGRPGPITAAEPAALMSPTAARPDMANASG